jgi:hypothetical protein
VVGFVLNVHCEGVPVEAGVIIYPQLPYYTTLRDLVAIGFVLTRPETKLIPFAPPETAGWLEVNHGESKVRQHLVLQNRIGNTFHAL